MAGTDDRETEYRADRPRFRVRCAECDWSVGVTGREQSATAVIGHGLRTGHDGRKERVEGDDG